MNTKIQRNAPCPCGSGKKYKNCCLHLSKPVAASGKKKFKASLLSAPKSINLIERTFGGSIEAISKGKESLKLPEEKDVQHKEKET